MTIDARGFDLLKDRLSKLDSLSLNLGSPNAANVPDLSKLTNLRHLSLADESGRFDLKPLEKLTQLKALTIYAKECKNAGAIGSLVKLEFLSILFRSPDGLSMLKSLPDLRYLAAAFPADTDFSFAEKMPRLQTLGILEVGEKHNLKPLEKLSHLRCLALSQYLELGKGNTSSFEAGDFKNVKEFEKARPDVDVVSYRGLCLGSFWLLPLAAAAAAAAWLIRRHRVGHKQVFPQCP